MPQTTLEKSKPSAPALKTYSQLLRHIRQTIKVGKARALRAVEREVVRTKWETGQLILEHILLNRKKGDYGKAVIQKLAKDLEMSVTELRYMVEFARTYSNLPPAGDLSWGDYRELLRVNDAGQRKALSTQAAAQSWTRKQLRSAIRKIKTAKGITLGKMPVEKLADLKPGTVGLYRIRRYNNVLYRDLGFSVYQRLEPQGGRATNPPEARLYTYEARVTRVVDGDTYYCLIDLGFDLVLEQRVRLRRLNAPEIITAEGQEAKKVLARVLKRAKEEVLVKVSKLDDQYGRYLVDTWVRGKNIDTDLLASGVFHVRG